MDEIIPASEASKYQVVQSTDTIPATDAANYAVIDAPESNQPGFFEGFKAGFAQKPMKTEPGIDMADVGHFVGQEGLPMLGGAVGALAGPAGAAIGAGAGRAAQKGIARAAEAISGGAEAVKQESVGQVIGDVGLTGLTAYVVPKGVSKAIEKAAPVVTKMSPWARNVLVNNPDEMAELIKKTTPTQVDLAAKKAARGIASSIKEGAAPELVEQMQAIVKAKNPGVALGEVLERAEQEAQAAAANAVKRGPIPKSVDELFIDLGGDIPLGPAATPGMAPEIIREVTSDFVKKKAALDLQFAFPKTSLGTTAFGFMSEMLKENAEALAGRAITGGVDVAEKVAAGAAKGAAAGAVGTAATENKEE